MMFRRFSFCFGALLLSATMMVSPASSALLLDDDFSDGDLATNPDLGGGFDVFPSTVGNPGSAIETGSVAQLTSGNASGSVVIATKNSFPVNPAGITATFDVDATPNDVLLRDAFMLQAVADERFAGQPAYRLIMNQAGTADFSFKPATSGAISIFSANVSGLDAEYTVEISLTEDTYSVTSAALGLNESGSLPNDAKLSDLGSTTHIGVLTQNTDPNETNRILEIDRITYSAVPEPSTAVLALLAGLGLVACRNRG